MSCLSCAIFIRNLTDYRMNSFENIMNGIIVDIDDNYVYINSRRKRFLITKESLPFKISTGIEIQFQIDKQQNPILIKKKCFYKRYYVAQFINLI